MHRTALILTLSAAACASSQPTEDEYNDVAQAIGSTTATGGSSGGEVASLADSAKLALGQMPAGMTLSGSGHFTGQHVGLDYDYQISCSNAAGQALAACNSTTDRAQVTVAWSGSLDVPNLSASVERTGSWTLSAIQSGTPVFAGEGAFQLDIAVTSVFRPVTSTYHLDYHATYTSVALDSAHRPVGGSIHYAVAGEHTVTGTRGSAGGSFDVDAVVTFAADGTASLTLDGSRHYQVNLATGAVTRK
jgi:hypothetical protein